MLTAFAKRLEANQQTIEDSEKKWDEMAEMFYYNQLHGTPYHPKAVLKILVQKGIIEPTTRVLDIGAGSGRYTIPLAKHSKSVKALDLSTEMLQYLTLEIEKNKLDNVNMIKSAWPTSEDIGPIDVAFSSMCPATRSVEALKAISSTAKNYGVVCQFVSSVDTVDVALRQHDLVGEDYLSALNNRQSLQAYFNVLWELGYNPEITYVNDIFINKQTLEDAMAVYTDRYPDLKKEDVKRVLTTLEKEPNDHLEITRKSTLAVINWRTSK